VFNVLQLIAACCSVLQRVAVWIHKVNREARVETEREKNGKREAKKQRENDKDREGKRERERKNTLCYMLYT